MTAGNELWMAVVKIPFYWKVCGVLFQNTGLKSRPNNTITTCCLLPTEHVGLFITSKFSGLSALFLLLSPLSS